MKIGFDARQIILPGSYEEAGLGHYTYYLIKYLLQIDQKNHYVLFFDNDVIETKELEAPNVTIRFFPFFEHKKYLPLAYYQILVTSLLTKEKLDVFHSPATFLPLIYPGKTIVTVHDLSLFLHPEWYPSNSRSLWTKKILIPLSLKKADSIIAVSENTKKDLLKIFKLPAKKIKVVPLGVESEREQAGSRDLAICQKFNLEENYLFYIGTLEPRKNLITLIRAFESLLEEGKKPYQLVLAGQKGWKCTAVLTEIDRLNKKINCEAVRYLGYVSHEDKILLMRNALCFVFPSLYEGFGLPILEAMSLGVPVVAARTSALPEIAQGVAEWFKPLDISSLTKALRLVLSDEEKRKNMVKRGYEQAEKYTWQKTATKTLKIYQELRS